MQRFIRGVCLMLVLSAGSGGVAQAQHALTWDEVKARFENDNPTLRAGKLGVDETRAQETTAYLRPNPNLALTVDQINPFDGGPPHSTFGSLLTVAAANYLHERQHKRELRLESAKGATEVAEDTQADLERTLLFSLRGAFLQTLQAKAVLNVAKENLAYYDHVLDISRERFKAGDIAQIDLDRLELQRVQFESDLQTAEVDLRTAKIQLLMLLNERTPVEQFDVTGPFGFSEQIAPLDDFRRIAVDTRPDLKAAVQAVDKARTDHKLAVANGSTDPTFGFDVGRNPPIDQYFGFNVSIPLRIFDRNQGEKLRTQLDIDRNQRLLDAAQAQVFSDVDSAYAMVNSNLILLRPYKSKYLQQAVRVRDTITFSYQQGGASLLDFLSAENDYRSVQLNYVNLVGSYLTAAAQLNLAVGREAIP
ncbi:MAG TPA: TolC family protein [Candidatus Acidoferrum sp.]|nr:TolC family protein [Candidatus Acidoferrum sp.]